MKNSCYRLLLQEIDILKPDIVIIQGKFSGEAFQNELKNEEHRHICEKNSQSLGHCVLNGHSFYILWGYHPTCSHWSKHRAELKELISEFKKCQP